MMNIIDYANIPSHRVTKVFELNIERIQIDLSADGKHKIDIISSRLDFVNLVSSERISKCGASGQSLKEA